MIITRADIDRCAFRHNSHHNLGYTEDGKSKGYGYGYVCVEYPRLSFINWYYSLRRRKADRYEQDWLVDGAKVDDLDAAVAALNRPPVITAEERTLLDQFPSEYVPYTSVWEHFVGSPYQSVTYPDTPAAVFNQLYTQLMNKGLIEYEVQLFLKEGPVKGVAPDSVLDSDHVTFVGMVRRRP